jgi:hypothetical protein
VRLEQVLPPGIAAFLDQALHFLRPCTSRDEESVRHVDNDQVIDTETCDTAARTRDNNSASNLLRQNCRNADQNEADKDPVGLLINRHTIVTVTEDARLIGFGW